MERKSDGQAPGFLKLRLDGATVLSHESSEVQVGHTNDKVRLENDVEYNTDLGNDFVDINFEKMLVSDKGSVDVENKPENRSLVEIDSDRTQYLDIEKKLESNLVSVRLSLDETRPETKGYAIKGDLSTKDDSLEASQRSLEWMLSSGDDFDFNFEEDFEVRADSIEEALEAIPSALPPETDEDGVFHNISIPTLDGKETSSDLEMTRIPLFSANANITTSDPLMQTEENSKKAAFEFPRYFQTTVSVADDVRQINRKKFPSNNQSKLRRNSQEENPKLTPSRSRRVPSTLPPLPPPKESPKNSLFGDFFSKKSDNENELPPGPDKFDKVKTKLSSALNNVRYGWTIKTKTNFQSDSAIWLLGALYHPALDSSSSETTSSEDQKISSIKILDMFKSDFTSRIWFTYRREFPVLSGSNLTTDCGWGCMLRSAQMLLAQSFVVHFLGRDWRLFSHQDRQQEAFHRQIIRWFGDYPSDQSPFSVHRLVKVGQALGKKAGDWYGPSSVAHIAKEAMQSAVTFNPLLAQLRIYVAKDCTIYIPDVLELCSKKPRHSFSSSCESNSDDKSILPYHLNAKALSQKAKSVRRSLNVDEGEASEWSSALLLLVPVRLGGETLNEGAYMSCVKSLLALKESCGIIGGRPKHSLFFVGYQEDKLIHLDPHFCQDVVDFTQRDFPLHTFHCVSPRKMTFSKMDPSCTFGFYLRSQAEFDKFVVYANEIMNSQQKGSYPMFVFSSQKSEDVENTVLEGMSLDTDCSIDIVTGKVNDSPEPNEDDYVLL